MSYLVLARKYRPETFADIAGQDAVVRTLENAIRLDRVHHAFLFTGARGVGKTSTARVLARALNCQEGPTIVPCGKCGQCKEVRLGNSPDVLEIDGASNTGVDNVRGLRESARYLPQRGRFKIYIIDEVHMLSQAAFNALLKTLEEPPPHVKFIFATTEPHKIPATILSRCQRFDFRRVSAQQLDEHLRRVLEREGVTLGETALRAIAREAQGSVRDALSLLDQVLSYAGERMEDAEVIDALGVVDRETIFRLAGAVLGCKAHEVLGLVAEVDARGYDLAEAASLLVEHFRDLMVAKVLASPSEKELDRSPGEIDALKEQAGHVERVDLHRLFRLMVHVAEEVSRSQLPRVCLEMGLLRLVEVEPATSVSTLLRRVDSLLGDLGSKQALGPSSGLSKEAQGAPPTPDREPDWSSFVGQIRVARPAVASMLEHAHVLSFAREGVSLGYGRGSFYWEQVNEPSVRQLLVERLQADFGEPVGFKLVELDSDEQQRAPASLADMRQHESESQAKRLQEQAVNHPAVRNAVEVLGGQISEVVPLARDT